MANENTQVVLVARPDGIPEAEHFELRTAPIPAPAEGEILIRNRFVSVDPAMRGWVSAVANYSEPVAIGSVMRAIAVGEVFASRHSQYAVGSHVCGLFGWQEYALSDGSDVWFRHDPEQAPLSTALGILGINGITAYHALLDVGAPRQDDRVVVSTAAGAVGSAVGQIARIKGCRTVGITSSADKMALCREVFGYDEAISYREGDLDRSIAEACPGGVDVYFDNTAGRISDAVHRHLAERARIVVCGTASIAAWEPWPEGPRLERHILVKRAHMQGFLLFDYFDRFQEARDQLAEWLGQGRLHYREDVLNGLDQAPGSIRRLYDGANTGKLLIRL